MQYFFIILLLTIMLLSVSLERYYSLVPLNELKRRRRNGDSRASLVYEVVRNLSLAKLYLNGISLIAFSLLVVYIGQRADLFGGALVVLLIIAAGFIVRSKNKYVEPVAVKLAPHFALLIVATRPYAIWLKKTLSWLIPGDSQTSKIYAKEDLIEILEQQKHEKNNTIDKTELDLALHALKFGEKLVKDYMTPRKVVRFVKSDEPVSTVLMSELHDSGFSRFPVYMEDIDNIVGTLYLKDLVERRMTGKVFSAMSNDYYEIQETEKLEDALKQFLKTQHHLFVVKNQFHELVGVITIEDVIEQMMGRKIIDEFDVHDDMREHAKEEN